MQDARRIFLVFGNQFVKFLLLSFHDGFADHSDVVAIALGSLVALGAGAVVYKKKTSDR